MTKDSSVSTSFDVKLAHWREDSNTQGVDYGRLRRATLKGEIHFAKINGCIWLNKKQAEEYLDAFDSQLAADVSPQSESSAVTRHDDPGLIARLVAAVEDMAVAIRQAAAAVSSSDSTY